MRFSIACFTALFATALAVPALKVTKSMSINHVRDAIANKDGKVKSTGSLRTHSYKADSNTMFAADVAIPANFKAAFKKDPALLGSLGAKVEKKPSSSQANNNKADAGFAADVAGSGKFLEFKHGEERRRLQDDVQCVPQEDGTLFCVGQDLPGPGFITVFICPGDATTIDQCQDQCFVFMSDDVTAITETTPRCSACGVCGAADLAGFNFACSNFSQDKCAAQDCAGECVGTGTEPTDEPFIECFAQTDGTTECALENSPRTGLIILFTGCPANVTTVLECTACEIPEAASYDTITDTSTRCNSCSICVDEQNVAFDCANFDPTEPCSVQDCNSTCLQNMSPTPTTQAPSGPVVRPDVPSTSNSPPTPAPVINPPTAPPESSGAASQGVLYSATFVFGVLALFFV